MSAREDMGVSVLPTRAPQSVSRPALRWELGRHRMNKRVAYRVRSESTLCSTGTWSRSRGCSTGSTRATGGDQVHLLGRHQAAILAGKAAAWLARAVPPFQPLARLRVARPHTPGCHARRPWPAAPPPARRRARRRRCRAQRSEARPRAARWSHRRSTPARCHCAWLLKTEATQPLSPAARRATPCQAATPARARAHAMWHRLARPRFQSGAHGRPIGSARLPPEPGLRARARSQTARTGLGAPAVTLPAQTPHNRNLPPLRRLFCG